jgi:DNA-binding transcriptional MerR regulator
MDERRYRVGEFATLTGVSIRALHHYDQLGLLRPAEHSEAGYRLYSERDLLRLQQILTLRYLGFALKQIGQLLDRPNFDLVASLCVQQVALRQRIGELQHIEAVLRELLRRRLASGQWEWELVAQASADVQASLQQKGDNVSEYYSAEQMKQALEKVGEQVSAAEVQQTEEDWTALVRDVRASRQLDPSDPRAQALADRWNAFTAVLYQRFKSDPTLMATIQHNYNQGAYANIPDAPTQEDFAFIAAVNQARGDAGKVGSGGS